MSSVVAKDQPARSRTAVSRDIARAFSNWPMVLTRLAAKRYLGVNMGEILWRTRGGPTFVTPSGDIGAWRGIVESVVWDAYRLRTLSGVATFVDIGANVGGFSCAMMSLFPEGRGLAVEPSPRTFAYLRSNLKRNGADQAVECVSAAVTGRGGPGEVRLFEQPTDSVISTVVPELNRGLVGDGILVRAVTLPDLLAQSGFGSIDVLKVDVEGAEFDILRGLDDADLRGVRRIVLEYHPVPGRTPQDVVASLDRAGFDLQAWEASSDSGLGVMWFEVRH